MYESNDGKGLLEGLEEMVWAGIEDRKDNEQFAILIPPCVWTEQSGHGC